MKRSQDDHRSKRGGATVDLHRMRAGSRSTLLLAVTVVVIVLLLAGGPIARGAPVPRSEPAPTTTTPTETTGGPAGATATTHAGSGGPATTNDLEPANTDETECIGFAERPNCGSKARGGFRLWLLFGAMVLGLGFIAWRIVVGVRRTS